MSATLSAFVRKSLFGSVVQYASHNNGIAIAGEFSEDGQVELFLTDPIEFGGTNGIAVVSSGGY